SHLAETHSFRSGTRVAEKVVPCPTDTDSYGQPRRESRPARSDRALLTEERFRIRQSRLAQRAQSSPRKTQEEERSGRKTADVARSEDAIIPSFSSFFTRAIRAAGLVCGTDPSP